MAGAEPAEAGPWASPKTVLASGAPVFPAAVLALDVTPEMTVTSWPSVEDEAAAGLAAGLLAELAGGGGVAKADVAVVTTDGQTCGMSHPHEATWVGLDGTNVSKVLEPPEGQHPMARPDWPQVVPVRQQLF